MIPCETCIGTGEISGERARWISEGRLLHRYRLGREPDMFNAAFLPHGVTLREWVEAEAGRVDPAPMIARVLAGQ